VGLVTSITESSDKNMEATLLLHNRMNTSLAAGCTQIGVKEVKEVVVRLRIIQQCSVDCKVAAYLCHQRFLGGRTTCSMARPVIPNCALPSPTTIDDIVYSMVKHTRSGFCHVLRCIVHEYSIPPTPRILKSAQLRLELEVVLPVPRGTVP